MANNRLWAVCKDDNNAQMITKYYPPEWDLPEDVVGINRFLKNHKDCPSNHGCGENIVFVTEVDDERVEKYDFTDSVNNNTKIYIKK